MDPPAGDGRGGLVRELPRLLHRGPREPARSPSTTASTGATAWPSRRPRRRSASCSTGGRIRRRRAAAYLGLPVADGGGALSSGPGPQRGTATGPRIPTATIAYWRGARRLGRTGPGLGPREVPDGMAGPLRRSDARPVPTGTRPRSGRVPHHRPVDPREPAHQGWLEGLRRDARLGWIVTSGSRVPRGRAAPVSYLLTGAERVAVTASVLAPARGRAHPLPCVRAASSPTARLTAYRRRRGLHLRPERPHAHHRRPACWRRRRRLPRGLRLSHAGPTSLVFAGAPLDRAPRRGRRAPGGPGPPPATAPTADLWIRVSEIRTGMVGPRTSPRPSEPPRFPARTAGPSSS